MSNDHDKYCIKLDLKHGEKCSDEEKHKGDSYDWGFRTASSGASGGSSRNNTNLASGHGIDSKGSLGTSTTVGRNEDSVIRSNIQTKEGKRSNISSVSGIDKADSSCSTASGRDRGVVDACVKEGVGIDIVVGPVGSLSIEDVCGILCNEGEWEEVTSSTGRISARGSWVSDSRWLSPGSGRIDTGSDDSWINWHWVISNGSFVISGNNKGVGVGGGQRDILKDLHKFARESGGDDVRSCELGVTWIVGVGDRGRVELGCNASSVEGSVGSKRGGGSIVGGVGKVDKNVVQSSCWLSPWIETSRNSISDGRGRATLGLITWDWVNSGGGASGVWVVLSGQDVASKQSSVRDRCSGDNHSVSSSSQVHSIVQVRASSQTEIIGNFVNQTSAGCSGGKSGSGVDKSSSSVSPHLLKHASELVNSSGSNCQLCR